ATNKEHHMAWLKRPARARTSKVANVNRSKQLQRRGCGGPPPNYRMFPLEALEPRLAVAGALAAASSGLLYNLPQSRAADDAGAVQGKQRAGGGAGQPGDATEPISARPTAGR